MKEAYIASRSGKTRRRDEMIGLYEIRLRKTGKLLVELPAFSSAEARQMFLREISAKRSA
jgi:hypothetical protein